MARSEQPPQSMDEYIERVVADAPPLTREQKARLAALLSGGARDEE